jgi:hypothetical protein
MQGRAEQEEIEVHMVQRELLKVVRALACCSDPMTHGDYMLPDGVVEPLHQDLSLSRFLSGMMHL